MNYSLLFRTFTALLALCFAGCAFLIGGIEYIQHAPIKLRAQQEQQLAFTIIRKHKYFFGLHFEFKGPEDYARLVSLMEGVYDRSGQAAREGAVPTPVRLTVKRLERTGAQEVLSIERDPSPSGATTRSTFEKHIGSVLLTPGRYVVTLTPLETVKEFENTQVELTISYDSSFLMN